MNDKIQPSWLSRHTGALVQGFIWALLIIAPSAAAWLNEPSDHMAAYGFLMVMSTLGCIYYVNYLLLIPRLLFREKIFMFVLLDFVCVLTLLGLTELVSALVLGTMPTLDMDFLMGAIMFYVLSVFIVMGAVAVRSLGRQKELQRRQADMQAAHAKAELSRLKSQLNPHFLFNSLNNISALSAIDPEATQDAIGRLSAMLRYVLYDTATPLVNLRDEIEFLQHYIALMSLRYGSAFRLDLHMELPEQAYGAKIPPMLFISLIENAFKYGASSVTASRVAINIEALPTGCITLRVVNTLLPVQPPAGHGLGLKNLRARLELLFPSHHVMICGAIDDKYSATLTIPLTYAD